MTFAQAMARNTITAANSAMSRSRVEPSAASWSVESLTPRSWFDSGNAAARRAATASMSRCAPDIVTPGFIRPIAPSQRLPRFSSVEGAVVSEIIDHRHPDVGVERDPAEAVAHDADDGEWAVVERDGSTDDAWVASELRGPHRVADHGDGRSSGTRSSSDVNVLPRAAVAPTMSK